MGALLYKDTFSPFMGGGGAMGGGGGRYSASNNGSYAGSVRSSSTTSIPSPANNGTYVGTVSQAGTKNLTNFDVAGVLSKMIAAGAGLGYQYYTDEEKKAMGVAERSVAERNESIQKVAETQKQKVKDVKEETKAVADSVSYEQGQTLPSVLSQNAKAITQAINALTTAFTDQFSLLNNYMMGNLIYQQQFLDIKTAESPLKIESMEYNKTTQPVYDLDGNKLGDAVPRDLKVQKDAVVGIDTTDKINFDIDDLNDDDSIDLSSIVGYDDGSDIMRQYIERLGGTVNG